MEPQVRLHFCDTHEAIEWADRLGLNEHNCLPAAGAIATLTGRSVEAIKTAVLGRKLPLTVKPKGCIACGKPQAECPASCAGRTHGGWER